MCAYLVFLVISDTILKRFKGKVAKTSLSIINSAQDFYIRICPFLLDNIG